MNNYSHPHVRPKNSTGNNDRFEISPSDIAQARIRVAILAIVVAWSFYLTGPTYLSSAFGDLLFTSSLGYLLVGIFLYGWSLRVEAHPELIREAHIKRSAGLIIDLCGISYYTAIAGEHGFLLYPVFLTVIIGNGYRFGIPYLYASVVVALISYTAALWFNPALNEPGTLKFAYYLGLIAVPLYTAALLKRHRTVLDQLKLVNESRSRFIANVSHEFRTPLHGIISSTDLLREDNETNKQDKRLKMISESAMHLLGLVNRVLDVASADAGVILIKNLDRVDLYHAVISSANICAARAAEKKLELNWHINANVPQFITGSTQHLQEIFVNCIGNAVKYTEKGHVKINVELRQNNGVEDSNVLMIEIRDTGCGIKEETLESIFEPFALADDSLNRRHGSTGLGLTITKHYVEQLSGKIFLESKYGEGTNCVISFPASSTKQSIRMDTDREFNVLFISCGASISDEEVAMFQKANIHPLMMEPSDFMIVEVIIDIEAIFIDSPDESFIEDVIEHATKNFKDVPLISYQRTNNFSHANLSRNEFRSTVSAKAQQELINLSSLLAILNSQESQDEEDETRNQFRVLVADDNRTNRQTIVMALEAAGHDLVLVDDGEKALEALEEGDFDIALLDMHMPGMTGTEAAKFYNFGQGETPVLLLTADVTQNARREAEESGIDAVLYKPLRPKELRNAIQKYARKKTSTEANLSTSANENLISSVEILELRDIGSSDGELIELVREFREDCEIAVNSAREAAKAGRFGDVRNLMHGVKGAAATIGAIQASKLADRLEKLPIRDLSECVDKELNMLSKIISESTTKLFILISPENANTFPLAEIISFSKE